MKTVYRQILSHANALEKNRLFSSWLCNEAIGDEDKLAFTPMAIDFIMGFRDFNKYYVRYPDPKNELERSLNAHAAEDETHSALLLSDWGSLGMDQRLRWAPRDLYWWMTCDETLESRRVDFDLVSMAWHNPDPLMRFAIVESMEAAGRVFFTRTVPIVDKLAAKTGADYPYYGKYHLDRETGHLQNGADERPFFRAVLTEAEREKALGLVRRVFEIFSFHFDNWETFARDILEKRWDFSARDQGRACATLRDDRPADVSAYLALSHPADPTGVARDLAEARARAFEDLWNAPAYRWVREAFSGDFRAVTRYFLLQWVVDNWACADYFTFDTTYREPASALERGINRLSLLYASEMRRRYVEWETLQFDDYTQWNASDALRHYWLDELVEGHRAVFADLRKLTFRYPKAIHRYWILKCFVRFGDSLMHSLGVAMKHGAEKDENFITFAGQPERLHPDLPPDAEADEAVARAEGEPLSDEDVAIIRTIIDETHRQEAERAALTWKVIQERRYEIFHKRWVTSPPPPVQSIMRVRAPSSTAKRVSS